MHHDEETKQRGAVKQARRDPVCGMNITAEAAFGSHEHGGRTFYFCSARCPEEFQIEPSKYGAK
ncbi:MAG: YHS domain-containing protein [Candidatus Acidiferrales bacterium]